MLDLADVPILDKQALVGGCLRLPLLIDATRLRAEIDALPQSLWGSRGGRVGVHSAAEALFLRGYAPAQGALPIEDREPLRQLPCVRELIFERIPGVAQRCLLAKLPAGAIIAPHVDTAPYFHKTLRVHVPVETHEEVYMIAGGLSYRMRDGEVWVLNNSGSHAVWNAHPAASRTHLICDFLPSAAMLEMMERGERGLGEYRPDVMLRVTGQNRTAAAQ